MTLFEKQEFSNWSDRDSGRIFEDVVFRRCSFVNSGVSITRDISRRSTLRNIRLVDCEQRGCAIDAAILDGVEVSGLKTHDTLITFGAAFRHVRIVGKIGEVMITPDIMPAIAGAHEQREFRRANAKFFESVDWALDISEAEFVDCDLRFIPPDLVRRDPRTQVVVKRERLLDGRWRRIDLGRTHWVTALEWYLKDSDEEGIVLVAGKRARNFKELLRGLQALRDSGIAEPD
jgi:hypothetical protein